MDYHERLAASATATSATTATLERKIGEMRVLATLAVVLQRTATCRFLVIVPQVCTRSAGDLIEIALGIPARPPDCPRLVVPIYLSSVFAGHLSYN